MYVCFNKPFLNLNLNFPNVEPQHICIVMVMQLVGLVMHIYVTENWHIIVFDDGLAPTRRQATV